MTRKKAEQNMGEKDEEEGKKNGRIQNYRERTQSRVGPLPPAAFVVHFVEDRVPYVSLHISAKVFIEAGSWATVVAADFQCFPDFQIVSEFVFIFVCHADNDLRFPVHGKRAIFFVLADTAMVPVAVVRRPFMFLCPHIYGAYCLPNVLGLG